MHSVRSACRGRPAEVYVVATAGHVDHGKSALVRALTTMEPDRWAEERRRGLTIDLGFDWMTTLSGADIAFVDVPGHERFLGNMLAGIGPAPVVAFVVAADEGWSRQSSDHRDAIAALGIDRGVLVISRADLADDERIADVVAQARDELSGTGLGDAPAVITSALTGRGIDELRDTIAEVVQRNPFPSDTAPVRFWIDRAFTIKGAGAVVTGTLSAGSVGRGDTLDLLTGRGIRSVSVRGVQSENTPRERVGPVSRVAVNLRDVSASDVARGDLLLSPGAWRLTDCVDIRRVSGPEFDSIPSDLSVHVGTAALRGRLRPFDADHARITFERAVPLILGDRLVLRDAGSGRIGGGVVVDAEPPPLRRRGDAARRADVLSDMSDRGDARREVERRGAVAVEHLRRLGVVGAEATPPEGVRVVGSWWVDEQAWAEWIARLRDAVDAVYQRDSLAEGLPRASVAGVVGLPSEALVAPLVADAGLDHAGGFLSKPGVARGLGDAEEAVAALERRLAADAFAAPEADDLAALGLGPKQLAAAERLGRLLRLRDGVVLSPRSPALAMRVLAALDQPFTTSEARKALGTTRRVAIPLLEYLDDRGWTRRLDAGHREVVR